MLWDGFLSWMCSPLAIHFTHTRLHQTRDFIQKPEGTWGWLTHTGCPLHGHSCSGWKTKTSTQRILKWKESLCDKTFWIKSFQPTILQTKNKKNWMQLIGSRCKPKAANPPVIIPFLLIQIKSGFGHRNIHWLDYYYFFTCFLIYFFTFLCMLQK